MEFPETRTYIEGTTPVPQSIIWPTNRVAFLADDGSVACTFADLSHFPERGDFRTYRDGDETFLSLDGVIPRA